jgi:o-succinylbenzoate synthase
MRAEWAKYQLDFRFDARTSRGSMTQKDTYLLRLIDENGRVGVGECALFRGLSAEDSDDYEAMLNRACEHPEELSDISSIRFGFETALADLGAAPFAESDFTQGRAGIPINGLIWMGNREEMKQRIDEKLAAGFNVLKMKIGGIDFDSECDLFGYIRSRYSADILELRLDANGSFTADNAIERLNRLSQFSVHSIEQPIKAGRYAEMAEICRRSPIAIALDEELIGKWQPADISQILDGIAPQYIILKPSLCGGFAAAATWADEAERRGIGWWATSALESNIGLTAIAKWVAARGVRMPQGLGTGQLYYNNFESALHMEGDRLYYDPEKALIIPEDVWRH